MAIGGNGILGKFQQRLRNIRINRAKKKKLNEEYLEEKVKEIHRVVENDSHRKISKGIDLVNDEKSQSAKDKSGKAELFVETVPDEKDNVVEELHDDVKKVADDSYVQGVVQHIHELDLVDTANKVVISREQDANQKDNFVQSNVLKDRSEDSDNELIQDNQKILNSAINLEDKKQSLDSDKDYGFHSKKNVSLSDEDRKKEIDSVKNDLLLRIQACFDNCNNELDVLESELYLLTSEEEYALTVKKIKKIKSEINEYVTQINQIIGVYNSYSKKYFGGSVVDIEDNTIADDLIKFRMLLNSQNDENKFVGEIKKLESFQKLYQHLNEIKGNVESIREDAKNKQVNFEERDKKYKEILQGALNVATINKSCVEEISKQNDYFSTLMNKVSDIQSHEYVTTRLRGFGDLVGMSLKYVGLLLLNPLKNTLPGIGIQTLATRKLVGNLYRNLHIEEVKHIHYEAIDYEIEINRSLSDVHYMSDIMTDTISGVEKLRSDFLMQYDSNIPGYNDTLNRLNDLYVMVLNNQKKLQIIEKNLDYGKKINEEKLVRVKELNEHE